MKDNIKTLIIKAHEQGTPFMITDKSVLNRVSFLYRRGWGHYHFPEENVIPVGGVYNLNMPV